MKRLLIVTPILPPAPGGAGVYTKILSESLTRNGYAEKVIALSETYPGQPTVQKSAGQLVEYHRVLPYRAGRSKRDLASYAAYAITQFKLRWIIIHVRRNCIDTVLLHSSFFHHPGLIGPIVKFLREVLNVMVILDVRDPLLPTKLFRSHFPFDAVICCSERLQQELETRASFSGRVHFAPIPMDTINVPSDLIELTLKKYKLIRGRYLFNANGISRQKRSDLLIDAMEIVWSSGNRLPLVIAGRSRDWDNGADTAAAAGRLIYLGPVTHQEVLALTSASAAVVNPSPVESPSRISLEAMMLGAAVLLPPNVTEFMRTSREFVCRIDSPQALAEQITSLLQGHLGYPSYDLSIHHPDRVARIYNDIFNQIAKSNVMHANSSAMCEVHQPAPKPTIDPAT